MLSSPLAASAGPDLKLVGTSYGANYDITAGTTEDFGLPEQVGQIVNVVHVAPLMLSETTSTAGLPNLILIYALPSIVERIDLTKPCPPSVNREMKLYSTLPGGIGILTKCCLTSQVICECRRRARRGVGTTAGRGLKPSGQCCERVPEIGRRT